MLKRWHKVVVQQQHSEYLLKILMRQLLLLRHYFNLDQMLELHLKHF